MNPFDDDDDDDDDDDFSNIRSLTHCVLIPGCMAPNFFLLLHWVASQFGEREKEAGMPKIIPVLLVTANGLWVVTVWQAVSSVIYTVTSASSPGVGSALL